MAKSSELFSQSRKCVGLLSWTVGCCLVRLWLFHCAKELFLSTKKESFLEIKVSGLVLLRPLRHRLLEVGGFAALSR